MVYSVQELLYLWESYGVFDYMFPFLLIFAVVFGILSYMNIFGSNKAINVLIAVVIGFMAIRFGWFNQFYAEIFPRLGIGIVVLLSILILIGLFIPEEERRYWAWGLGAIGVIIAMLVIYQTFGNLGWTYGAFGSGEVLGWIVFGILLLAIIIAVAVAGNPGSSREKFSHKLKGLFDSS